jgi:hypothetical protein
LEHLGESLKIPPQYEQHRVDIEKSVSPIAINIDKFR